MQETFKMFLQERHVHVTASAKCLLSVLFLAQELLSIILSHILDGNTSFGSVCLHVLICAQLFCINIMHTIKWFQFHSLLRNKTEASYTPLQWSPLVYIITVGFKLFKAIGNYTSNGPLIHGVIGSDTLNNYCSTQLENWAAPKGNGGYLPSVTGLSVCVYNTTSFLQQVTKREGGRLPSASDRFVCLCLHCILLTTSD